ncbi:vanin-like protein 2 [Scaptodrosophila lebanonensis]|uniref:Vanin-like protein 2 n=1 Tax=Drosophila lebanonensis TaxID=7225 RepID=A0A6J2U1A1_DROLE|nr:vanin-like protein 2 [Scaptodrosophila lebanonensis]
MAKWSTVVRVVCLLAMFARISLQAAITSDTPDEDFYTAGVVEFYYNIDSDMNQAWSENLLGFLEIIGSENASATDIIVFPEATLNSQQTATFVPEPKLLIVPCLDDPNATYYHELLVRISCAAREFSKYVVINVNEKQVCSENAQNDPRPCAPNDLNIYNTNVVFDRNGTVMSRYRKVHLYGEPRNTTYEQERVFFETDFGVTFGHFICFDILFYTPAHELIVEADIRDFVFPSMWFSQLPFLTAVQFQHAWAYANNVNLLAAGASRPEVGSSGTGIYHGREGTLVSVLNMQEGEQRIYVARVPKFKGRMTGSRRRTISAALPRKISQAQSFEESYIKLKRDSLENYENEPLELVATEAGNLTRQLCHGNFCCDFDIAWRPVMEQEATEDLYSYRLGVYDGERNEQDVDNNYLRNCAIFTCTGPSIEQCGMMFESKGQSNVIFTRIVIEAAFPKSREFLLLPDSLREDLLPLEPSQFDWSTTEVGYYQFTRYSLHEGVEVPNLLTFAIYGNYYDDQCTFSGQLNAECGYIAQEDEPGGASSLTLQLGGYWVVLGAALVVARSCFAFV